MINAMGTPACTFKQLWDNVTISNTTTTTTTTTTIFTTTQASQSLGLLFYLVPPSSSSYKEVEDCPDLVARAMPFMVLLMVLEGLINTFHRRKEHNLADSITRWQCWC